MVHLAESPAYDPFDLWATRPGVAARRGFYAGRPVGKAGAVALALADWWLPVYARRAFGVRPRLYAVNTAQAVLAEELLATAEEPLEAPEAAMEILAGLAARGGLPDGALGWGHGFPWMSKNGLYAPDTPLVTITPYVMEALLVLARYDSCRDRAMSLFHATWGFLEELRVMMRSGDVMALSYAPAEEPRIVINANAYSAFAYALHATSGRQGVRQAAAEKAGALARWVVNRQGDGGEWNYYADDQPGNFLDGFHSCFVLKNLRKAALLLPELHDTVAEPLGQGWAFLRQRFYDRESGLCRRFIVRDIKDPYRWDLYDQAEYLGQLVDFAEIEEARAFRDAVRERFSDRGRWYCRIDLFGRRWGRDFLRWGVMPYFYHSARLLTAMARHTPRAP